MADFLNNQFRTLVDEPNETLAVEYKGWPDLSSIEARAGLARHIAALANYGGGTIVFGITNAMQFAGANPYSAPTFDRDLIASIVKKYLEPVFQCDVHLVLSSVGNSHPVVVVPPHGATPICAKANGPLVGNKTFGIVQGAYYTRKPGPASEQIQSAAEWAAIIRRCAMHERAAILGALDAALRGSGPPPTTVADALKKWHDAAHTAFLNDASAQDTRPNLARWHWQVSYIIERGDGQLLRHENLIEILREVHAEVADMVRSGWNMINPQGMGTNAPHFQTDAASGLGDMDFLEFCALQSDPIFMFADMWRVSPDGKLTLIREYWEDVLAGPNGTTEGTWISPNWMVRSLAEIVRHASAFTERFENPTTVSFRCEWHGLRDRKLHSPNAMWFIRTSVSRTEDRTATGSYPVTMLTNGWPDIVAELVAPLMRSFSTDHVLTPDWIRGQAPTWLQ